MPTNIFETNIFETKTFRGQKQVDTETFQSQHFFETNTFRNQSFSPSPFHNPNRRFGSIPTWNDTEISLGYVVIGCHFGSSWSPRRLPSLPSHPKINDDGGRTRRRGPTAHRLGPTAQRRRRQSSAAEDNDIAADNNAAADASSVSKRSFSRRRHVARLVADAKSPIR